MKWKRSPAQAQKRLRGERSTTQSLVLSLYSTGSRGAAYCWNGREKKNSFKKVTTSFSRHSLKYSITDVIDTVSGES
jgi:hypothetical protein